MDASMEGLPLPKLSLLQQAELEEPLWLEKVGAAIVQIARNKIMGTDGLLVEYYATFITHIAQTLLDVYNKAHSRGQLPDS
ncbi:hypothetical protein NDU88_005086 [Pleurodeles waltl]|uniref:Uncharacterized protein n=1 Tax=Pleurodeles waltl TaxID=8319 RepID=A0AAV7W8M4_PLEWA|nr:hypothetical protein NDU88_005086 [Pleurodeles waltl]